MPVALRLRRLMARRGDLYENRVTGERGVVLRGDIDGGGLSGLVHLTVKPGGAVAGEHVHPAMDERFHVVSGRLQTRIAGTKGQLGPGEDALASAGTPHDWWNSGDVPANVIVELSPGSSLARFEAMIATLFGLANTGRTNAKGLPPPLQLALTASEFSDVIQMTKPPAAIQRAAFTVLGAVARRRGLRATYPELLVPHGTIEPDPAVLAAVGLT
jgi:mannose-6-phosphate isomerase-like protein (cupin superfamily)